MNLCQCQLPHFTRVCNLCQLPLDEPRPLYPAVQASTLEQVERHRIRIQDLRGLIEAEQAQIGRIQRMCNHPRLRKVTHQGDTGTYCPDCGETT